MKLRILKKLNTLLLCLLFGFSLAACGGGGGDDSSTAQMGTVSLSITDNPGLYNAVVLSIEKVGVVTNNSATVYYNSADISELPVTVDILDFPDEATLFLGDIEVPLPDSGEVCINQIRLVLADEGNYVIEKSDPEIIPVIHNLKTPSGQQSGVKLLVKEEAFCLSRDDDAVNVTIEFDPATAIIVKENSANPYQLKPTSMRIIAGNFFHAPESFIAGMVRVPSYNTATGCYQFDTAPVVTVAAYTDNSEDPTSKTVALLTDEPVKGVCYYEGAFKLLLPDQVAYNLEATWDVFKVNRQAGTYNSPVLLELAE